VANHVKVFVLTIKKLAVSGAGVLAVTGVLLMLGAATAGAAVEDIQPDPAAPSSGPLAEDGVRVADPGIVNGGRSEVRVAELGVPLAPSGGETKDSLRAVPSITGGIGTYIDFGPFDNGPPLGDW
jgi:hypothetical protein